MSDEKQLSLIGSSDSTRRANKISKRASKARRRLSEQQQSTAYPYQVPLELGDGHDVTLWVRGDRAWLEIDVTAHEQLDAVEGDRIVVGLVANGQRRDVIGIMGSGTKAKRTRMWRVWLPEVVCVDDVEAVTIKRERPV